MNRSWRTPESDTALLAKGHCKKIAQMTIDLVVPYNGVWAQMLDGYRYALSHAVPVSLARAEWFVTDWRLLAEPSGKCVVELSLESKTLVYVDEVAFGLKHHSWLCDVPGAVITANGVHVANELTRTTTAQASVQTTEPDAEMGRDTRNQPAKESTPSATRDATAHTRRKAVAKTTVEPVVQRSLLVALYDRKECSEDHSLEFALGPTPASELLPIRNWWEYNEHRTSIRAIIENGW